ncbi:MAG: Ig-like domain-containing protein [Christensenella sp.]|nr:Ig-like domain-containing protein [Christensenella sp.]
MKKTSMIRVAAVLSVLALAFVIAGVPGIALAAVDSVSITPPASSNIPVGGQVTLTGAASPGGTPGLTYAWTESGSHSSLSSPTNGTSITVTGLSVGDSTIRLTAYDTEEPAGNDYAEQIIHVVAMSLTESSTYLIPGATAQIAPNNYTGTIAYSTGNSAVATVSSSGLVTAVGSGTTNITVTNTPSHGGAVQTLTYGVTVPTVTLNPSDQTVTAASTAVTLTLTVANGGTVIPDGTVVTWQNSNTSVGALSTSSTTVSGGSSSVTFTSSAAATNGTATIRATIGTIQREAKVTVRTTRFLDIVGPTDLNKTTRTGTYTVYLKNADGTVVDNDSATVHWSWSSSYLSLTSDSINDHRANMHDGEAHIQLYARYNTPTDGTRLYAWLDSDSGNKVYHTIRITGLSSLPQTGQDMTLVYVFGGLGAALLAATGVWYGIRKKRTVA